MADLETALHEWSGERPVSAQHPEGYSLAGAAQRPQKAWEARAGFGR
jgi:hypothetical protein